MKWLSRRSLEFQLAAPLAVLYVAATLVGVAALVYQAYATAESLDNLDLRRRALDLAGFVQIDEAAGPQIVLPPKLARAYEASGETFLFAVRDAQGRVIAAATPEMRNLVSGWPAAGDEESYFRLEQFGRTEQNYYGLTLKADSRAGALSVTVARAADATELVHSVLQEFVLDIAWTIPLIAGGTLMIGVLAIRRGLQPLREASSQAAAINPASLSVRLPQEDLPTEIRPLVEAVNHALDRLEKGFVVQRQFTANAAHELRTPLAVIAAALEQMEGNGELSKLRLDVVRMSRLVEQLLRVARLDAIALDVSGVVNLSSIAAEVVAYMAPVAVARRVSLGAQGVEQTVYIKGNRHAVEDALRNLIENAISHTPPGTEVTVAVAIDGSASVADHGAGVHPEDREHIFERFWRARGEAGSGAGLGLAIVKEIMNAHRGSVSVHDNPGGGAVFVLHFPKAAAPIGTAWTTTKKLMP